MGQYKKMRLALGARPYQSQGTCVRPAGGPDWRSQIAGAPFLDVVGWSGGNP